MAERRGCEISTASDGTVVRVNGDIDQETLDATAAWVRAHMDSRCHDASPYPMPAIAQRLHDRETYRCGRERGHDGEHRWPDKPEAKWRWPTPPEREEDPMVDPMDEAAAVAEVVGSDG